MRPGRTFTRNTVEGVFSLIKRGVMGTFHCVSRKHLPNYLNEFEFRWNTRKGRRRPHRGGDPPGGGQAAGYRESVDNPPYLAEAMGQLDAPLGDGE